MGDRVAGAHTDLHTDQGARQGEHPGRSRDPVIKVHDIAWLEFEKPDLIGAEAFARAFGFSTVARTDDELHLRGTDVGSPCVLIRRGPRSRFVAAAYTAQDQSDVLRLAGAQHAASIIVATSRDDTAVLVTLTAREIAAKAKIVASIREAENQHLLQQSGADSVVVSSETAGRLLGLATTTPSVVEMIEDLLTPYAGLAIAEREVEQTEIGGSPRHLRDIVLGVVRDGHLLRIGAPEADAIEATDRLLYIRDVGH
jgi:Trk K+ transport system NAD-binding subunit